MNGKLIFLLYYFNFFYPVIIIQLEKLCLKKDIKSEKEIKNITKVMEDDLDPKKI